MQHGRKLLTLLLTAAVTLNLFAAPVFADGSTYSDTRGHWAEGAIERWNEYRIVNGNNGAFLPDASMTRAQLAKVLANLLGLTEETAGSPFDDVPASEWYAPYMLRCHAAGILRGADGKGNPNAPVSRQEAMTMIARALGIAPADVSALDGYRDAANVADWAAAYVAALTSAGIVNGVGDATLAPENDISRASVMTLFDKAVVQFIDCAGTYALADKAGIVLVAAGGVTLTGETRADVLITPAADHGTVGFEKATVTGRITVQADDAKITASADSKLTAPTLSGTGTVYSPSQTTVAGGSSGGGHRPNTGSSQTITSAGTVSGGTYSDVTITDGVGDGEVTLTNVTVNGDLTIRGGGSHSIILDACTISGRIIFDKASGEAPRMYLTGGTDANEVVVNGNVGAIIEAADSSSTVGTVEANKPLEVRGSSTKVDTITVPENATATVTVKDAEVSTVDAQGATTVKVDGATISDVKASGTAATTIEEAENAKSASTITKVTAEASVTIKTDVATVEVPETATQKVEVTVNGGTVSKVEAKSETEIRQTESGGTVGNVEATAAVTVDQSVVEKVTVPESATGVSVAVNGTGSVEVEVNTESAVAVTGSTGNVTVSTASDTTGTITVGEQTVTHIHKWNDGVVQKAATCTAEGEMLYTCTASGCDNPVATKSEPIAKTAHKLTAHAAADATCTDAGSIAYWECSVCHKLFSDAAGTKELSDGAATSVAALGHDWNEWTHDATNHTRTCKRDAKHVETAEHSWNDGIVTTSPTETETGVMTYTCDVCGATKTEEIAAIGTEDENGGLHWESAGVLAWDEAEGAFGYCLYVFNGDTRLWYANLVPADLGGQATSWDLRAYAMHFSEAGEYRVELWTINDQYRDVEKLGEIEGAISVKPTMDPADYTFAVTSENSYTISLTGEPAYESCVWEVSRANGSSAQNRNHSVVGGSLVYAWSETWWAAPFVDGDKIDLRLITNSQAAESTWYFTITPASVQTYQPNS